MERKFPGSGNIKASVLEGGMAGRCESKEEQFQMELVRAAWARSFKAFAAAEIEMRLFS